MAITILHRISKRIARERCRKRFRRFFEEAQGFTMIGREHFVDRLELAEKYLDVEGDFVECGVWRGGMSYGFAKVLGKKRHYYLFDSFEGMPKPDSRDGNTAHDWYEGKYPATYYENCRAEESYSNEIMMKAGVGFSLVKGWFENTVPHFKQTHEIAVLHLDADWYDSMKICLDHLFPKVVNGGIVILDDYYVWEGTTRAVHDYLSSIDSRSCISRTRNGVAYIIKRDEVLKNG